MFKAKEKSVNEAIIILDSHDSVGHQPRNKEGRPKGMTAKTKREFLDKMEDLTTKAMEMYSEELQKGKQNEMYVPSSTLNAIIKKAETYSGIDTGKINKYTVRSIALRENVPGRAFQSTPPLEEVEPVIVQYCLRLATIGKPLTRDQVTSLCIPLIKGTPTEEKLMQWKKRHNIWNPDQPLVGLKWYNNYMSRYKVQLKRGRARFKYFNCQTWCTLEHFKTMYNSVYASMVDAGIAKTL
jgi:hypothetical protein